MKISQTITAAGGVVHEIRTRGGERFSLLVEPSGPRTLRIPDPDRDEALLAAIELEPDEADALGDLLHSSPIVDRVASLERRLEEHLEHRTRQPRDGGHAGPPGGAG